MSDTNTTAHDDTRNSVGDTAVNADPQTLILQYGDYKVPAASLPNKALAYLLQNGFSQSMTDAAALTKVQKQTPTGNKVPNPDKPGEEIDEVRDMTDAELDAKVKALRDARYAKILAGEVGIRVGGPRGSPIDTIIRQVAVERMRAKLAKFKLSLPVGKGKDGQPKTVEIKGLGHMTRDQLIDREIEKNGDEVRAEATRRMAVLQDEATLVDGQDDI